jgi:hypothetical protein
MLLVMSIKCAVDMFKLALVNRTKCQFLRATINVYCKSMNVTDFRGISISCVVSKVMEHFIFDRYQLFFSYQ